MDNKRLILVMLVATLLMAMWALGLPWVAQQLGLNRSAAVQ